MGSGDAIIVPIKGYASSYYYSILVDHGPRNHIFGT